MGTGRMHLGRRTMVAGLAMLGLATVAAWGQYERGMKVIIASFEDEDDPDVHTIMTIAGLQSGDIIVEQAGYAVTSWGDWERASEASGYTGEPDIMVVRGNEVLWLECLGRMTEWIRTSSVELSDRQQAAVREARGDPYAGMTASEIRAATGQSTHAFEFEGEETVPRLSIPECREDPYGGRYWAARNTFATGGSVDANGHLREYTYHEVRWLSYFEEDIDRAKIEAARWVDRYVTAFQAVGYRLLFRYENDTIGTTVGWGAWLERADPRYALKPNCVRQRVEVCFQVGHRGSWSRTYTEVAPTSERAAQAMRQCRTIAASDTLTDAQKADQFRVVQRSFGESFVAEVLRRVPVYSPERGRFQTFDQYMVTLSRDTGYGGTSPIDRDPVGAGLRIFFDPSASTIRSMLGLE